MIRSIFAICCLCISAIAAAAPLDSVSYALGYELTRGVVFSDNDVMNSRADFEEFLATIEKSADEIEQPRDSSYTLSYFVGTQQAMNWIDTFASKDSLIRIDCVLAGLRNVADENISMPQDSIMAKLLMTELQPKLKSLGSEDRCRFFTAYGMMKGLQPGLSEYLATQLNFDGGADRQAYARGMADLIATMLPPKSAAELASQFATSLRLQLSAAPRIRFNADSFILGARGALTFDPVLIPPTRSWEILKSLEE